MAFARSRPTAPNRSPNIETRFAATAWRTCESRAKMSRVRIHDASAGSVIHAMYRSAASSHAAAALKDTLSVLGEMLNAEEATHAATREMCETLRSSGCIERLCALLATCADPELTLDTLLVLGNLCSDDVDAAADAVEVVDREVGLWDARLVRDREQVEHGVC